MISLRTATGPTGWHDATTEAEAAEMVACGRWVRADSLCFEFSKHGHTQAEAAALRQPTADALPEKRKPGRPRKAIAA